MAGDNPLDRALLDDNSTSFVNRLLGLGTISKPPPAPPTPPIDPTLVARTQKPPTSTPPIAPPTAAPPTLGAVRPSPNDVPGAKPPDDPLAQPQPYQSRVLAPGGPAAEFLAYQKTINDQARKDAMFQQLGNSIRGIGASWSQNPAHVQALSAGSGAVPISMPAGPISANDFLSFSTKTEDIRKAAIANNELQGVADSLGLTLAQARSLRETNPTAFGLAVQAKTPEEKQKALLAARETAVHERQAGVQEREATVAESADARAERLLQEVTKPGVALHEREVKTAEDAQKLAVEKLATLDLPELERQKVETAIRQKTEQRQREELERTKIPPVEQDLQASKRAQTLLSDETVSPDEVKYFARTLNEDEATIRTMTRGEAQNLVNKQGTLQPDVALGRAVAQERRLAVPPPEVEAAGPEAVAKWRRELITPTQENQLRMEELKTQGAKRAAAGGPEAQSAINVLDKAEADQKSIVAGATQRTKQRQIIGQGVVAGTNYAEMGLEFKKTWQALVGAGGPPPPDIPNSELAASLQHARLQLKAKESGLGTGNGFTDTDSKIVQSSIGGSATQTPEGSRHIFALDEQLDRFKLEQLNDQIMRARGARPDIAHMARPIELPPISEDMRRYVDNDAVTKAITSKAGRDYAEATLGKRTVSDLIDSPAAVEQMIQSKLTHMNQRSGMSDIPDDKAFNAMKNVSVAALEKAREATLQTWKDKGFTDRDPQLYDMIIAAKKAGKFGNK